MTLNITTKVSRVYPLTIVIPQLPSPPPLCRQNAKVMECDKPRPRL